MKKRSLLAISIIAVLLLSWVIATWYTGKAIEKNIQLHTDRAMASLSDNLNNNAEFKATITNYQRGIFSATFDYEIHAIRGGNADFIDQLQASSLTLYHGPFPLPRFVASLISPKLLHLNHDGYFYNGFDLFQQLTKKERPINTKIDVTYGGVIKATSTVYPINNLIGNTGYGIDSSELIAIFNLDNNNNLHYSVNLDRFRLTYLEQKIGAFEHATITGTGNNNGNLPMGQTTLSVNNIFFSDLLFGAEKNNKGIAIANVSTKFTSLPTSDQLTDVLFSLKTTDAKLADYHLGNLDLQLSSKNLPLFLFRSLQKNPTLFIVMLNLSGRSLLNELAENNTTLNVDHFIWNNPTYENRASSFSVVFNKNYLLYNNIQALNGDISLSIPLLADAVSHIKLWRSPSQPSKEQVSILKLLIKNIFIYTANNTHPFKGILTGPLLRVDDKENIVSSFQFSAENGLSTLNGRTLNLNDKTPINAN